ncbi:MULTISPECIES: YdeI/OmpD-associated family protein [Sorangium]|uniref:YdeI/OmpD-associated family protein n=1 Tax=Sorangium TaxID=39643 RepID=UPI003D9BFEEC
MAPIVCDKSRIKSFPDEAAFEAWLAANHAQETELWLTIYKKDSGVPTVTHAQAPDVALCWGRIDGTRKALDESSFLQRFSPRKARSVWSRINRYHIARLTAAGRMTPHGQRHVDVAKADGRWDAKPDGSARKCRGADREMSTATVPSAKARLSDSRTRPSCCGSTRSFAIGGRST